MAQHKAALNEGVLSIGLGACNKFFRHYKSGIFDNTKCPGNVDHAVAMVGWGTLSGTDYWIIRNSWGTKWGDNGYIKIAAIEGDGICGSQLWSALVTTN